RPSRTRYPGRTVTTPGMPIRRGPCRSTACRTCPRSGGMSISSAEDDLGRQLRLVVDLDRGFGRGLGVGTPYADAIGARHGRRQAETAVVIGDLGDVRER